MSHDVNRTSFSIEQDMGSTEANTAPALKTWVTPKVITSTLQNTDAANSFGSDGATAGSHLS